MDGDSIDQKTADEVYVKFAASLNVESAAADATKDVAVEESEDSNQAASNEEKVDVDASFARLFADVLEEPDDLLGW